MNCNFLLSYIYTHTYTCPFPLPSLFPSSSFKIHHNTHAAPLASPLAGVPGPSPPPTQHYHLLHSLQHQLLLHNSFTSITSFFFTKSTQNHHLLHHLHTACTTTSTTNSTKLPPQPYSSIITVPQLPKLCFVNPQNPPFQIELHHYFHPFLVLRPSTTGPLRRAAGHRRSTVGRPELADHPLLLPPFPFFLSFSLSFLLSFSFPSLFFSSLCPLSLSISFTLTHALSLSP